MKAIKELKLRLPTERKAKGHTSTLNALKYALQCVKQVRGEGGLFVCSFLKMHFVAIDVFKSFLNNS